MRVLILGCGPAGLLAAHAVEQSGQHSIDICSKAIEPSHIHGAQYVHKPIPGIHDPNMPDGVVRYEKWGKRGVYARKVYGDTSAPCSWDTVDGRAPAWMMEATYEELWQRYSRLIYATEITPYTLDEIKEDYNLVISSIPAWALCHKKDVHVFDRAHVSFKFLAAADLSEDNVIIYNGENDVPWYRRSELFGHGWDEYGGKIEDADYTGVKPISTSCDCYPDVRRVGRFGQWSKGVLVHDAYYDTLRIMERNA